MHTPLVSLDLETTGFVPHEHNIIEIGAVRVERGVVVDELSELICPGEPIPSIVTSITSITDEMVATAPTIDQVAQRVRDFVQGAIIVGHNITFDIDFLAANKLIDVHTKRLDTWRISELVYPNAPSNSLEVLASLIGVEHTSAHRALDDAKAAYILFEHMQARLAALPKQDVQRAATIMASVDPVLSEYLTFCASLDGSAAIHSRKGTGVDLSKATNADTLQTAVVDRHQTAHTDTHQIAVDHARSLTTTPHWSDLAPPSLHDEEIDSALVQRITRTWQQGGQAATESLHGTLLDKDIQAALKDQPDASCVLVRPGAALATVSDLERAALAVVLDEPYAYVSWDRLEDCATDHALDEEMIRTCALISLWKSSLEDGRMALLGVPVGPQARSALFSLRATDVIYQERYAAARAARACIVSHASVLSPHIRPLFVDAHVVIESGLSLERAAEYRARHMRSEPAMHAAAARLVQRGVITDAVAHSISIVFGLVGMAAREWRQWFDVAGVASCAWQDLASVPSYWRVQLAARSLADRLNNAAASQRQTERLSEQEAPNEIAQDLSLLQSTVEWLMGGPTKGVAQWWFMVEDGVPVLYRQPAMVTTLLQSAWDAARSVHVVDDAVFTKLPPQPAEPLLRRLGLRVTDVSVVEEQGVYAPTAIVPLDLPPPGEPGVMQRLHAYIERAVRDLGGSILVVATSQTMVRDIYHALIDSSVVANAQPAVSVYAHHVTGGMGKSLSKYTDNPRESILILGSKAWGHRALHALQGSVDTLIIPKIPFTPLSDPLYQVKQEQFVGFESFSQLQLPDMIRAVRSVVRRVQPRQVLCADTRIQAKPYGRQLLQALGCSDPRSVSLSTRDVYNVS